MNTNNDYSVIIRTLGNAGEKYLSLLNSISNQTIKPKEIIVVLPYGNSVDYSLGNEKFIYTEKGMVNQRVVGINSSRSEYVLVVDDDVCFYFKFVELIFSCMKENKADVVLPAEETLQTSLISSLKPNLYNKIKEKIIGFKLAFIGQRFYHNKKSDYVIKIAPTGGHSINPYINEEKCYLSQSGNFQCFFMKTNLAQNVHFQEEMWLEETKYAIYDDQVFFYKSFLLGHKIVYAPKIKYSHLSAAVGHSSVDGFDKIKRKLYGNMRNRTIFWYRFLYQNATLSSKVWLIICYSFGLVNTFLFYFIKYLVKPQYLRVTFFIFKGSIDAFKYCKTLKKNNKIGFL